MTQILLKELIDYNEITGSMKWKISPNCNVLVGSDVGSIDKKGYMRTKLFGRTIKLHHIAWFIMYGYMPVEIDHKDRNKTNNSKVNLREVTHTENMKNLNISKANKSGHKGVYQIKSGRWASQIGGKNREYLGSFETIDEAISARKEAETKKGYL